MNQISEKISITCDVSKRSSDFGSNNDLQILKFQNYLEANLYKILTISERKFFKRVENETINDSTHTTFAQRKIEPW